jgi:hypothetical protein
METVRAAAARAGAWVSIGVNERDPAGGTLYNTQLYFTPDGQENYMPLARYAGPRGEVLAGRSSTPAAASR